MLSKRQRAAKKGWVTRRKRERAEFLRRSRAAKNGWVTRRANQGKGRAKIERQRDDNVEWVVSIDYTKRKSRSFTADIIIIARMDSTPTQLADQAREQLPEGKSFLANWIEGEFVQLSQGKSTNHHPSTHIRSFKRHKS